MNKITITIAAIAALVGTPALAADMAIKAPLSVPAPIFSWTGFYLDAGGGHGMWNADTAVAPPFFIATNTEGGRGWFGSVGGGFDYQFGQRIVAGILADFDFSDMSVTFTDPGSSIAGTMKETSFWAAGARIGWLVTPELLTYVSGGFTQAHFSSVNMAGYIAGQLPAPGVPVATIAARTYDGWFLGTGVETTFPFSAPVGSCGASIASQTIIRRRLRRCRCLPSSGRSATLRSSTRMCRPSALRLSTSSIPALLFLPAHR